MRSLMDRLKGRNTPNGLAGFAGKRSEPVPAFNTRQGGNVSRWPIWLTRGKCQRQHGLQLVLIELWCSAGTVVFNAIERKKTETTQPWPQWSPWSPQNLRGAERYSPAAIAPRLVKNKLAFPVYRSNVLNQCRKVEEPDSCL